MEPATGQASLVPRFRPKAADDHRLLLRVQLPVPPPAPPVPPPAAPVPPPAPEPLFPALPPFPPPDEPDPLLLPLALWSLEGWPGLLLGAIVERPIEFDWVPVASARSPGAAKMSTDMADSTPASNSEVILMLIMVRLQR